MRSVGLAGPRVRHHLKVAMVGGDHHGRTGLLGRFQHPAETLINDLGGLYCRREDASMADHVRIGIVHQDEPVLFRKDALDKFIRYRTGDVGVLDDTVCSCGRGLPLLKEIQGRTTDFVVARDGTVMHGLALIYVLRDQAGIRAFKIIQESLDRTRVLIEPADDFRSEQLATIERGLIARLGEGVQVDVELVPQIAPEASGKFRYVVSHVAV